MPDYACALKSRQTQKIIRNYTGPQNLVMEGGHDYTHIYQQSKNAFASNNFIHALLGTTNTPDLTIWSTAFDYF